MSVAFGEPENFHHFAQVRLHSGPGEITGGPI
jgi:hypothetical protein